jgi:hypothetical protein
VTLSTDVASCADASAGTTRTAAAKPMRVKVRGYFEIIQRLES